MTAAVHHHSNFPRGVREMKCQTPISGLAGSLEPAPPAIVAAAENQQYDEYDQKCRRVHDALLWAREPTQVHLPLCLGGKRWTGQTRNLLSLPMNRDGRERSPATSSICQNVPMGHP